MFENHWTMHKNDKTNVLSGNKSMEMMNYGSSVTNVRNDSIKIFYDAK